MCSAEGPRHTSKVSVHISVTCGANSTRPAPVKTSSLRNEDLDTGLSRIDRLPSSARAGDHAANAVCDAPQHLVQRYGRQLLGGRTLKLGNLGGAVLFLAVFGAVANAEEQLAFPVCTGYHNEVQRWALLDESAAVFEQSCAEGQALLSARNKAGPARAGVEVPLGGTCCPLPPEVLSQQHSFEREQCPADSVITGFRRARPADSSSHLSQDARAWRNSGIHEIRCTKLNTERYRLGLQSPGLYLGWYQHFRTLLKDRTTRSRLPLELRYGLGRIGKAAWAESNCVGAPWGSLLTAKTSKWCDGFYFAPVVFASGDHQGRPAFALDRCAYLENPLDRRPRCVDHRPADTGASADGS